MLYYSPLNHKNPCTVLQVSRIPSHIYTDYNLSKTESMLLAWATKRRTGCRQVKKLDTEAVSTTAHLTKYTQMKYTAIECNYMSSALRRWLVLSQMEHLR